jgi:hypothetical protein
MFCKNNISKKIGCEKGCEKSFLESLAPYILAGGVYFFSLNGDSHIFGISEFIKLEVQHNPFFQLALPARACTIKLFTAVIYIFL